MNRIIGIVALVLVCVGVLWAQNTIVLLNHQYNAESTGNVLTVPEAHEFAVANCDTSGGGYSGWDIPSSGNPTYACISGTDSRVGALDFTEGSTQYAFQRFRLPQDWTGTVTIYLYWSSTATSGNAVWQLQTTCVADTEIVVDSTWNTVQTVTDATQGTTNRLNTATIASVTTTGCAAGELFKFRLYRDPAHASDTIAATARLISVQWVYRRAI
jgi:hypothetical protein